MGQSGKHAKAFRIERASLREDYLNQVQRDFLSRRLRSLQHPQQDLCDCKEKKRF
jgi:hypothetical protein